jgi:hypothetical protein
LALRIAATLTVLLLTVPSFAAYGEGAGTAQSETLTSSNWDVQCLADLSGVLESEIESLKIEFPHRANFNRNVTVSLQDGEATVMIFSLQRGPLLVGDRVYHFSCEDKVLTYEPYPQE